MGSVVCCEFDLLAETVWELLRELEDISYGRAAESVQALIVVADDTEIKVRFGEFEQDAFLDSIGVLILIDH